MDFWSTVFVFVLASFIGMGVIRRVSRLLHTPLMSLTNAISAIAVVGAILITGGDYPLRIRVLGAIALGLVVSNMGAMYRLRYPFWVLMVILGAGGIGFLSGRFQNQKLNRVDNSSA